MGSINNRLIKELIKNRGLTTYSIAKALDVGVATVDNWLKGKKKKDGTYILLEPSSDNIKKLCSLYDIDFMYIMTGEKNTNKVEQVSSSIHKQQEEVGRAKKDMEIFEANHKIKMIETRLKMALTNRYWLFTNY